MSEDTELKAASDKLWQEYLQKCCEVGQLEHAIDQIDSQRAQVEKNLDVAKKAVKSIAAKHRDNQSKALAEAKNEITQ